MVDDRLSPLIPGHEDLVPGGVLQQHAELALGVSAVGGEDGCGVAAVAFDPEAEALVLAERVLLDAALLVLDRLNPRVVGRQPATPGPGGEVDVHARAIADRLRGVVVLEPAVLPDRPVPGAGNDRGRQVIKQLLSRGNIRLQWGWGNRCGKHSSLAPERGQQLPDQDPFQHHRQDRHGHGKAPRIQARRRVSARQTEPSPAYRHHKP